MAPQDFSGQTFQGKDFRGRTDLTYDIFFKYILVSAPGPDGLVETADDIPTKLINTNLAGADFREALLAGVNASGANFSPSLKPQDANFSGATFNTVNLSGANLTSANLTAADLSGEPDGSFNNLSKANFTKANLSVAKLKGANFTDATLVNANLQGADLESVVFMKTNATGADFRNTNFTDASLQDSIFDLAKLSGVSLTDTRPQNPTARANLRFHGADLSGFSAEDVNLAGSDFSAYVDAKGVVTVAN